MQSAPYFGDFENPASSCNNYSRGKSLVQIPDVPNDGDTFREWLLRMCVCISRKPTIECHHYGKSEFMVQHTYSRGLFCVRAGSPQSGKHSEKRTLAACRFKSKFSECGAREDLMSQNQAHHEQGARDDHSHPNSLLCARSSSEPGLTKELLAVP